ncbi:MAG TPA: hypothetical protein VFV41_14740 [Streptosporangiaceae bacterium]|nr:hypothetical protein [Streptosporangiaceae bacterium]
MNDLKDLLELALSDGHGPDPAQRPDPAADLARGRRLLRRRHLRLAGATAGTAAVVAAAVVPVAVSSPGHRPAQAGHVVRPGGSAAPTTPASAAGTAIALVAYEGRQPPGYRVSEVPRGWVIQGGNAYVLTLAPKGDTDTSIDSFVGKLVVMLQSRDASAPTTGIRQPVAGRPGRFDVQGKTQMLTYKDAAGTWVVIQAPTSLGWDSTRLARFAAGVQVLGNAQQSRG